MLLKILGLIKTSTDTPIKDDIPQIYVQWETDPVNGQAREAQQHCFVEGSPDKFEPHVVGHCPAETFSRNGS